MAHLAVTTTTTEPGPVAAAAPRVLQYPPAIPAGGLRGPCRCGNITARGHGFIRARRGFSCAEVLDIRASVLRAARREAARTRAAVVSVPVLGGIALGSIAASFAARLGWI